MTTHKHFVISAFDVIYAVGGKQLAYRYHPRGEGNEENVRRFLKSVKDVVPFIESELGRPLSDEEIELAAAAPHVVHEHNWIEDSNWDDWL